MTEIECGEERKRTYTLSEGSEPVTQCQLVGVLVVVRDGRNGHVPFVRHSANRGLIVFHSKVHIASSSQDTSPALLLSFLRRTAQSLHDQVLGVVVTTTARAKLRERTAILQQSAALAVCLLLLVLVVPVLVAEHEIRLAGECQQRDLVENRLEPETINDVLHVAFVVITASIIFRCELDLDLLGWSELEGLEVREVCVSEVGAILTEPFAFFGGNADDGQS